MTRPANPSPLGSFSQPDPLAGSLTDPETGERILNPYLSHISPYAYCAGDPINNLDPTGCKICFLPNTPQNYIDAYNTAYNYLNKDGVPPILKELDQIED